MFKNIYKNGSSLIFRKQGSIVSAAIAIMIMVLLSRILGLFRDRLLATYFSVDDLGIYFAAFRMPNFIFEMLIMGILSTAFIPVFTHFLIKESEEKAMNLASNIINLSVIAIIIIIIPLYIFANPISYLLVPGFNDAQRAVMVNFTRIMLLGQLVPLIIGNYLTGMLQSWQRFLLPAFAPVVYNIGIIIGIVLFANTLGLYAPVWGVVIGAVLFLLVQIPLVIRLGYRHKLIVNRHDPGVTEVLHLMLPRTFGLISSQIDTTVDLILASFLGARSITVFNFALHLQQVPIGLFGGTFAQAALPTLSLEAAKKDLDEFKKLFLASMHQILFFVLPASAMLIVLRTPIVRLVFGAAKFDWAATNDTGKTLSFFAISIFAQSLIQLFARGFYSLLDTKTPVIISAISVVINTLLSIFLVSFCKLPVWSLAISTSISSIINALVLFIYLYKKVNGFDFKAFFIPPLKMFIASIITGVFLYVPMKLLDQLVFDTTQVINLVMLTLVASICGLSIYIFLAWFLNIEEVATFFKMLKKMKKVPQAIFSSSAELVTDNETVS